MEDQIERPGEGLGRQGLLEHELLHVGPGVEEGRLTALCHRQLFRVEEAAAMGSGVYDE